MISRRLFLGLASGAAGALLVPELLVPKRTFFLPPRAGWGHVYTHTTSGCTITLPSASSLQVGDEVFFHNGPGGLLIQASATQVMLLAKSKVRMKVVEAGWVKS